MDSLDCKSSHLYKLQAVPTFLAKDLKQLETKRVLRFIARKLVTVAYRFSVGRFLKIRFSTNDCEGLWDMQNYWMLDRNSVFEKIAHRYRDSASSNRINKIPFTIEEIRADLPLEIQLHRQNFCIFSSVFAGFSAMFWPEWPSPSCLLFGFITVFTADRSLAPYLL